MSQISSFAELVFVYRSKAHLSQQEVAEGIGVTRITEFRWEHGITMPNVTNMRVLAEFLHIPEQELAPFLQKFDSKHQAVLLC